MIVQLGNVECKLTIEPKDRLAHSKIEKELRGYFREKVPGAFFTAAYKRGGWDGYRYFITSDLRFPTGFLPSFSKWCSEMGLSLVVNDVRKGLPTFNWGGDQLGKITLRDYQVELLLKANKTLTIQGQNVFFPRGIYDAATNAGKQALIAGLYSSFRFIDQPGTGLFLIHNTRIYEDVKPFFQSVFGDIGEIAQKTYDFKPGKLNMAMVKTLINRSSELNVLADLQKVDCLFIDESHRAGADDYARLIQKIPAPVRFCVSGTPLQNDNPIKNLIVAAVSGPVLGKISHQELVDQGFSKKVKVVLQLNDCFSQGDFYSFDQEVEKYVHYSPQRLADTIDFCQGDQQVLIVYDIIEHGNFLFEHLSKAVDGGVTLLHAQLPVKVQQERLQEFKDKNVRVLIANTVLQEGVNIYGIEKLVYCLGGKSKIQLKQFIGRGVRKDEDKILTVLDWFDTGKWVAKHSKQRIDLYKEEGYMIQCAYEHNKNFVPIN